MPFYIYIIQCNDGSYYTGYTRNVEERTKLHMNGKGSRYTKMHPPKKLVYIEEYGSRVEAMRREREIKRFNHQQKWKLVNKNMEK